MKFASELIYPEVQKENRVPDAKLLMPSYAGMCSELSSIVTYSYQSFISVDKELENILMGIAKVEMLHFSLLGRAIFALGGFPVAGARSYWNGNMANYAVNKRNFLIADIENEKVAVKNYERTILNVGSESLKALLERIVLDEELHIEILSEYLASIDKT